MLGKASSFKESTVAENYDGADDNIYLRTKGESLRLLEQLYRYDFKRTASQQ